MIPGFQLYQLITDKSFIFQKQSKCSFEYWAWIFRKKPKLFCTISISLKQFLVILRENQLLRCNRYLVVILDTWTINQLPSQLISWFGSLFFCIFTETGHFLVTSCPQTIFQVGWEIMKKIPESIFHVAGGVWVF